MTKAELLDHLLNDHGSMHRIVEAFGREDVLAESQHRSEAYRRARDGPSLEGSAFAPAATSVSPAETLSVSGRVDAGLVIRVPMKATTGVGGHHSMAATQKSIAYFELRRKQFNKVQARAQEADHASVSDLVDNIAEATGLPRREAQFKFGQL